MRFPAGVSRGRSGADADAAAKLRLELTRERAARAQLAATAADHFDNFGQYEDQLRSYSKRGFSLFGGLEEPKPQHQHPRQLSRQLRAAQTLPPPPDGAPPARSGVGTDGMSPMHYNALSHGYA